MLRDVCAVCHQIWPCHRIWTNPGVPDTYTILFTRLRPLPILPGGLPGKVPVRTGVYGTPSVNSPGDPRDYQERSLTRIILRVDDLSTWVCPNSMKWSRMALRGASGPQHKRAISLSAPYGAILAQFIEFGQTQVLRSSTRGTLSVYDLSRYSRGSPGESPDGVP